MAQLNWERIRQNPGAALRILVTLTPTLIGHFFRRIFNSPTKRVSFRVLAGTLLCSVVSSTDHRMLLDAPDSAVKAYKSINLDDSKLFVIPDTSSLRDADIIVLFCHGGGFSIGHPLQYRSAYGRWVAKALQSGLKLAVVAVQYPLAPSKRSPDQLNAVVNAYLHLLDAAQVPAQRLVIAGDSAGGNLAAAALLRLAKRPKSQRPGGAVLFSPWIDLTLEHIKTHPCLELDILVSPAFMEAVLVPAFAGDSQVKSEWVSPMHAGDMHGLPPQLVVYGDCEVMQDEARIWIQKSRAAGSKVEKYVGRGQLHAFGVGGLACDWDIQTEVDATLVSFLTRVSRQAQANLGRHADWPSATEIVA